MSKRRSVLVVGAGSIGERHVRCLLDTQRADVAICEPNDSVREGVADRYRISRTFKTIEEAFLRRFEFAVVATPAPYHISQAMQLVDRGVHPLIEKPLSLDLEGIVELERAIAARDLTAGVAYPYRVHPALAAMRTAIVAGRFGRPLQITVVAGQHFPTYRPAYRDTYYRTRATGGGAIQDALTHLINAVEWFAGPTTSVIADAERLKLDGVEVEDTVHVLARHDNLLTTYSLNQHQPANELTITVVCECGQARFEGHGTKWSWITAVDGVWQEEAFHLDRDALFRRQAEAFISAVDQRTPPLCTIADGQATLQTVLGILASLESRRWEVVTAGDQLHDQQLQM